jgi:DNA-binding transcriptional ArsR family regulator
MAALCLSGGPLHGRFWHWMDRFYYEVYRAWRASRADQIAALERIAIEGLGSRQVTHPPELGWLPPDNMLVLMTNVAAAAESGLLDVVFWAEPFGIGSGIVVAPGLFLTSFAADGVDLEWHETLCSDLAVKLKALADPTRLSMLRVVRNMDFDNTQLGNFLEVSRPTISVHAKVLADAGLISTRREGRQARHTSHPAEIRRLCEDLLRFLDVPEDQADS